MQLFTLAFIAAPCLAQPNSVFEWHSRLHHSLETETQYDVQHQVFNSQPLPLQNGQMLYTNPSDTPIAMPSTDKPYAILSFSGEIVDEQNTSVPLSQVYDHHWIAKDPYHKNAFCSMEYSFGIGAESRRSWPTFPDGYGYVVSKPSAQWHANIHLLHTNSKEGVLAGDDPNVAVKHCNECWYAPGKAAACTVKANGTFDCCGEDCYDASANCRCPLKPSADPTTTTTVKLEYRLNYTTDVDAIKPLSIGVFSTPACATFYDVLANDDEPEALSSTSWQAPSDLLVLTAIGHQHTGALNISLFINGDLACTSYPIYGTEEGEPGNEKGYLVEMTACHDARTMGGPLVVKKGDTVRLDSYYWVGSDDGRLNPGTAGTHLNVMSYMYLAYAADTSSASNATGYGDEAAAPWIPELLAGPEGQFHEVKWPKLEEE